MFNYIHHAVLLNLFSTSLIAPASAVYRSDHRYYTENFDPAEADPRRNISCIGLAPGRGFPMLDNGTFPTG